MAGDKVMPDSYWREVRTAEKGLLELSKKRLSWRQPLSIEAFAMWEGLANQEGNDHVAVWQSNWLGKFACFGTDMRVYEHGLNLMETLEESGTATFNARLFNLHTGPLFVPTLEVATSSPSIHIRPGKKTMDRQAIAEIRASVKEQQRLGMTVPQPEDYEYLLDELRWGATGESLMMPQRDDG